MGPGDGVAHGLVASGQVAWPAGKLRQPRLQPRQERRRWEQPASYRRQLDREWKPIQPPADLGDGLRISRRQRELRPDLARALHEEANGPRF